MTTPILKDAWHEAIRKCIEDVLSDKTCYQMRVKVNAFSLDAIGSLETNVVSTPTIKRVTMPAADTETSYALPAETKRFTIMNAVGIGTLKTGYVAGSTSTVDHLPIFAGGAHFEEELSKDSSYTIYMQSPDAATEVVVLSWK